MFCKNLHAVCIPMCHARVSHTHVCVCDTRVCIPMRYILMCLTHTQTHNHSSLYTPFPQQLATSLQHTVTTRWDSNAKWKQMHTCVWCSNTLCTTLQHSTGWRSSSLQHTSTDCSIIVLPKVGTAVAAVRAATGQRCSQGSGCTCDCIHIHMNGESLVRPQCLGSPLAALTAPHWVTATHCNTLLHTATHRNIVANLTAPHYNTQNVMRNMTH